VSARADEMSKRKVCRPNSLRMGRGVFRASFIAPALLTAFIAAAIACGASTRTSTGPTPLKCQVATALSSDTIGAGGGKASVTVTAQRECAWTATASVGWISGLTPASGQGDGTVEFTVAVNLEANARQGNLVVNDQSVAVRQDPAPCRFDLAPKSQELGAQGGDWVVKVSAVTGCAWTATSNDRWIGVMAGGSGTRDGSVSIHADPNAGTNPRSGTVTIAGQTFSVSQDGQTPATPIPPPASPAPPGAPIPPPTSPPPPPTPGCTYTINPTSFSAAGAGASSTLQVQTASACAWAVTSDVTWIGVSATSGTGAGSISFTVAANTGAARTGHLTVGGQTLTVTQAAGTPPPPSCSYSINPASQSFNGFGGTGTIAVSTTTTCAWSATSNDGWITITGGASGIGNGNVAISIAPNVGPSRVGTVTVAGQIFTVNQAAVLPAPNCTYSIDPSSKSFNEDGATNQRIDVKTQGGCAWTAISNTNWITVTSGQIGLDDGEVRYNVSANPTGTDRTGTLTVAGKTFTVDQSGIPCSYTISPTTQTIAKAGGSGTVSVTTIPGCSWTATSQDSWIVVTGGGSGTGNGTVTYTVASNPGGSRKGTIKIAGKTFTVQQN
jgi:all-beta uncharacterized protein/BACON domain-containing protein